MWTVRYFKLSVGVESMRLKLKLILLDNSNPITRLGHQEPAAIRQLAIWQIQKWCRRRRHYPAFSSSKNPQNVNNYSSSTAADILPNNGETESKFYESSSGSDAFVDLSEYGYKPRKKAEKVPAEETTKNGKEAANAEYESDNGSSEEVVLPRISKNLKKKASAWDFLFSKVNKRGQSSAGFLLPGTIYSYKT